MKNSIFSIQPYKYQGTWVFDDDRVGLVKEPFVMGIPQMIELVLSSKGMSASGFTVLFSSSGIPEPDVVLNKQEEDTGGNWYFNQETGMRGWLCPALYRYYPVAPEKLYVKFITN